MKKALIVFLWLVHSCFAKAQDFSAIHPDSLLADLEVLDTNIWDCHPMMAVSRS